MKNINRAFMKMYKDEALRDNKMKCIYCRDILTYTSSTIEHKISKRNGGTDAKRNIQASCKNCNNTKGQLNHHEFIKIIHNKNPPTDLNHIKVWISYKLNIKTENVLNKFSKKFKIN